MAAMPAHRIATHPGALLREQIEDMGLSVQRAARDSDLPATLLHEIVHERCGVSAETAIALGEYFGQTPEFWLNAQMTFDLGRALAEDGPAIRARVRRRASEHAAGS